MKIGNKTRGTILGAWAALTLAACGGFPLLGGGGDAPEPGVASGTGDAEAIGPETINRKMAEGESLIRSGKLDEAIAVFNQTVEMAPDAAAPYHGRGKAFRSKGNFEMALHDLGMAIQRDPENPTAWFDRGVTHWNRGDDEAAIADFSQAIELDAGFAAAYFNRGNSYARIDDNGKAMADYERAAELAPEESSLAKVSRERLTALRDASD